MAQPAPQAFQRRKQCQPAPERRRTEVGGNSHRRIILPRATHHRATHHRATRQSVRWRWTMHHGRVNPPDPVSSMLRTVFRSALVWAWEGHRAGRPVPSYAPLVPPTFRRSLSGGRPSGSFVRVIRPGHSSAATSSSGSPPGARAHWTAHCRSSDTELKPNFSFARRRYASTVLRAMLRRS